MSTAISRPQGAEDLEKVLIGGDLARLTPEQRIQYYQRVCETTGLNPLTQPFQYMTLSGRLVLYARKDCTDQLRKINGVSVDDLTVTYSEGLCVATAKGHDARGRNDCATGAVNIEGLKGEFRANAIMKAETKAKRRFTLSICGLGILDETEVEGAIESRIAQAEVAEAHGLPAPQNAEEARSAQAKIAQDKIAALKSSASGGQEQTKGTGSEPHPLTASPSPSLLPLDQQLTESERGRFFAECKDAGLDPHKFIMGAYGFESIKQIHRNDLERFIIDIKSRKVTSPKKSVPEPTSQAQSTNLEPLLRLSLILDKLGKADPMMDRNVVLGNVLRDKDDKPVSYARLQSLGMTATMKAKVVRACDLLEKEFHSIIDPKTDSDLPENMREHDDRSEELPF